jgi:E3 ubiquitin-protein ligase MYCBP2
MFCLFRRQLGPSSGGGPGMYQVVKCGASGHNVRSRPSLAAPPVGMLVLGNHVMIVDDVSISLM